MGWEFAEPVSGFWWIKYLLLIFLSTAVLISPIDDLGIDSNYFYHFKTSIIKALNKTDKYELSKIKSIRCLGVHVPGPSLLEMATNRYQGGHTNTIEISFKDGSYKSIEVGVYKKELVSYISKVREVMEKETL